MVGVSRGVMCVVMGNNQFSDSKFIFHDTFPMIFK